MAFSKDKEVGIANGWKIKKSTKKIKQCNELSDVRSDFKSKDKRPDWNKEYLLKV